MTQRRGGKTAYSNENRGIECRVEGDWYEEKDYPYEDYKKEGHRTQSFACPITGKKIKHIIVPRVSGPAKPGSLVTKVGVGTNNVLEDDSLTWSKSQFDLARQSAEKEMGMSQNRELGAAKDKMEVDKEEESGTDEGEPASDKASNVGSVRGGKSGGKSVDVTPQTGKGGMSNYDLYLRSLEGEDAEDPTPAKKRKVAKGGGKGDASVKGPPAKTQPGKPTLPRSGSGDIRGGSSIAVPQVIPDQGLNQGASGDVEVSLSMRKQSAMIQRYTQLLVSSASELQFDSTLLNKARPPMQTVLQLIEGLCSSGHGTHSGGSCDSGCFGGGGILGSRASGWFLVGVQGFWLLQ